jgi:plastocyanin
MYNPNDPYSLYQNKQYDSRQFQQFQYNPYGTINIARPDRRNRVAGCFLGLTLLFGIFIILTDLVIVGINASMDSSLPGDPLEVGMLLAGAVILSMLALLILLVIGRSRTSSRKKVVRGLIVAGVVIGTIVGIANIRPPIVNMTRAGFVQSDITVNVGDHVHFANPSNGAVQVLCVGNEQHCVPADDEPTELDAPGLRIQPGHTATVVFETAGDYEITSETMPHMNIMVHVQDNSSDDGDDGGD